MQRQRGEGKLGCIISLLLAGTVIAVAYKAVPVYFGNSELIDACGFIASGATRKPIEVIEREVKEKARDIGVLEALAEKGAIRVTKLSSGDSGNCTIKLRYNRVIDFYGVFQWTLETDSEIIKPIFEKMY